MGDGVGASREGVGDDLRRFFAAHRPGLELPDGWFGRPFDNQHELTALAVSGGGIEIELDGQARMQLRGPVVSVLAEDGRSLALSGFDLMTWQWQDYGSSGRQRRREYDGGTVTFRTTERVLDVVEGVGEVSAAAAPPGAARRWTSTRARCWRG